MNSESLPNERNERVRWVPDPGCDPTAALLAAMTRTRAIEAHWADLLSQMEFVGLRKIIKAVPFARVDATVLRHVAEEASHAYLLKNAVDRLREKLDVAPSRSWVGTPLAEIGWRYFSELDAAICAEAVRRSPGASAETFYPTVSWAVEQRVIRLYPAYLERTREPLVRRVLQRILAQEKRHYVEAEAAMPVPFHAEAVAIEAVHWTRFCTDARAWAESSDLGI